VGGSVVECSECSLELFFDALENCGGAKPLVQPHVRRTFWLGPGFGGMAGCKFLNAF
jgi:hypothetical protein